jgi:hypothetical protein
VGGRQLERDSNEKVAERGLGLQVEDAPREVAREQIHVEELHEEAEQAGIEADAGAIGHPPRCCKGDAHKQEASPGRTRKAYHRAGV